MIRRDYLKTPSKSTENVEDARKQAATSKLQALDEDYIFQIFDHLSLADLCSMTKVNKYFRALTRMYFLLKYGDFDFNLLLKENEDFQLSNAIMVFDLFGDLIITLVISAQHFDDETLRKVFRHVNKRCKGTLIELVIEHLCPESTAIDELVPLMDDLLEMDSPFYHFDEPEKEAVCYKLTVEAQVFVLLPQCKSGDDACICKNRCLVDDEHDDSDSE